jgi:hypothetical protein
LSERGEAHRQATCPLRSWDLRRRRSGALRLSGRGPVQAQRFGFLGEARVNVLALNLALDALGKT